MQQDIKTVAIYARVSTKEQTPENQLLDLRRYAAAHNWTVQAEYVDHGVSGTKESRPALNLMMDAVRKRKVDCILVWRFDRFARSIGHLVLALEEMRARGVQFVSYQENIDTSTPLGKAVYLIVGAVAELERNIIIERIHCSLRRARAEGKVLGRRPTLFAKDVTPLRAQGVPVPEIAKRFGVTRQTVYNVLRKQKTVA